WIGTAWWAGSGARAEGHDRATGTRNLTEPLETTTAVFGLLFAAALVLGTLATLVGTGTVGGLGHAQVCVTDANIGGSSGANPFSGTFAGQTRGQPPAPRRPPAA